MKDKFHHMDKLVKKEFKGQFSEEEAKRLLQQNMVIHESKQEKRKKAKIAMRKEREAHIPEHKSIEEREKELKHHKPLFKHNPAKAHKV